MEKDDVEFETYLEEYSAKSFYEHYKDNLPQMVMVTQGYLGEVGFETFDRGQVFRIETYSSQQRVVALIISGEKGMYGLQGRQISIPADYDVKFNIIKHGKPKIGKSSTLKDILEHKDLPIEVQFAGSLDQSVNIGGSERTSSLFTLKLLHTYDDFYLLGNAICYGNLYGTVTAVPAYLPDLRFSIVKTIKGYTDEQYKNFLSVTDLFVKEHIQFDHTFGNTDIALYSHDNSHEDESYSYISPCEYYNIEEILRTNKPKPTKQSKKEGGNVYEVFRMSTVSLSGPSNPAYDTMIIDQSNANKIDGAQIQDVRKSLKPVGMDGVSTKKDGNEKGEIAKTENVKQLTKAKSVDIPSTEKRQNIAPPIPSKPDTSVLKRAKAFETDENKEKAPPALPKRHSNIPAGQVSEGTTTSSLPQKTDPVNIGRAAPLPVQPVPAYVSSQTVTSTSEPSSVTQQPLSSSINVPQTIGSESGIDIKSLTMEDVSDWLKKLKLEKYADVFLENQIDGCLLMELDRQILKEDFEMREFEIMKLMKFAKFGYVPKSRGSNQ